MRVELLYIQSGTLAKFVSGPIVSPIVVRTVARDDPTRKWFKQGDNYGDPILYSCRRMCIRELALEASQDTELWTPRSNSFEVRTDNHNLVLHLHSLVYFCEANRYLLWNVMCVYVACRVHPSLVAPTRPEGGFPYVPACGRWSGKCVNKDNTTS